MDLSPQLCVAESSTKVTTLLPARRLDLGRNLSFSLLPYFFNGLLVGRFGIVADGGGDLLGEEGGGSAQRFDGVFGI